MPLLLNKDVLILSRVISTPCVFDIYRIISQGYLLSSERIHLAY